MLGLILTLAFICWAVLIFTPHFNGRIKFTAELLVNAVTLIFLVLTVWFVRLAIKNGEQLNGNIATSLGSIVVTVFLLDRLNSRRAFEQRKHEIFEEVQSPVRDVAVEAMRLIRKYGWLDEVVKNLDLYQVELEGASLVGANLQGAKLEDANLKGAKLVEANLQNARLHLANLQSAKLEGANLQGAYLVGISLESAMLFRANLQGADLVGANLQNAKLIAVSLQRARLLSADLRGAWLIHADLQGAKLENAKLQKTYLYGANLQGTNLRGAKLEGAKYNETTIWPDGFDPQAAGAIPVKDGAPN